MDAYVVPGGMLQEREGAVVVDEVVVEPPGPGEVRVRAAGICHTDLTARRDAPTFPVLLGHEGAGVVEAVGRDVAGLTPGVPVVLSWRVPCNRCVSCQRGRQPWCESPQGTAAPRLHRRQDGAPVIPFLRAGTFCPYVVVPAAAAIPIPAALPPGPAALLGCGVATGVGAALYDAQIEPGMDVAVFGLGGVGLNVVQGAALAHAASIVAVDRVAGKLDMARRLGATDVAAADADPVRRIRDLTAGRGVDVAFEAVGHPDVMTQALATLAPGGTLILLGAAARDATLAFQPRRFMSAQQTIRGCIYGSCRPAEHFPLFARWALDGILQVDALISHTIDRLEDLNDVFAAMDRGEVVRAILRFPDA